MIKKVIILSSFIVAKFAFQYFAIDAGYELHRDEYLHLDLGKHLAWGYSSVPPLTSWISFIILHLGNSVFWVKFFPALFGALTMVIVWLAIEELKGGLFALILGMVCIMFSVLVRINTLYQPNSLDILMWTAMFFTLIKYINTEDRRWLLWTAVAFGIGILNKYNIAFLVLGMLPAILTTPHRKIFLHKHLYIAMLIGFIIIAPNLIWQLKNDFPVFHHLKALADTQLVNVDRLDFLMEQMLFFAGSSFVLILAFISVFRHQPFKKYKLFIWSYLFVIILFLYFKAKGYYALGLYPILFAFGSVYLEQLLRTGWLRHLRPVVILIPILAFLPVVQVLLPVLSPEEIKEKSALFQQFNLLRWEDGKDHALPQDYADMLGWKELAGIVDQAFEDIADKEHTIIHCDNYGQAGAINFYAKQNYTQALSLNADYINWYPLNDIEIKNVILVKESSDSDVNREREMPLFESISFVGEIKNVHAREHGARVYVLIGATQSINEVLRKEILERKNKHNL